MNRLTDGDDRGAFLTRLALKDYKSIEEADVTLARFTALVGPNGAGKSNVLDALRFVTDALRNSLEYALRDRGGIGEVRRRSGGHPRHFGIRLEMNLPGGGEASYAFRIGSSAERAFVVKQEECIIRAPGGAGAETSRYCVADGKLSGASAPLPAATEPDRLYLGIISGLPQFRPVYDSLTRMGFYNLSPARMQELQSPDPAEVLARDGANVAGILGRLEKTDPLAKRRIESYLGAVVPGLRGLNVKNFGPKETIEFRQMVAGGKDPWRFPAASMSDGTLRVLGVMVALFQGVSETGKPVPLVGIEEPEAALHPAATAALMDAILEAQQRTQILVTSHSPDLLDHRAISPESILAVAAREGNTIVAPVDEASKQALREGLYTPGELLRFQQIEPEAPDAGASPRQLDLFGEGPVS